MTTRYPKGSEWRKWDLHFHTPSSHDVNDNITDEQIVAAWKENNISVVAITDHHEIDINRIKNLSNLCIQENITVLPGIEFLSDARGSEPIHFIGIFSECCNLEHVRAQILNVTNLKEIKGMGKKHDQVYCALEDTIKLVHELGGIVSIHAGKKSNSMENITHSLPHGDAQKKHIANLIDIFEMGNIKDLDKYRKLVFPNIKKKVAMIICSDNHDANNYLFKEKLWIKGDPNFRGLKQATIEPDRIFLGEIPPAMDRINKNKTKTLESINISWNVDYIGNNGTWFQDVNIEINPEMTAIIGNKGNGKTALAEIIALLANTKTDTKNFMFLTNSKFKLKKLANNFIAELKWHDGSTSNTKNLGESPDKNMEELVHFVAQRSFENLCNDNFDNFDKEINEVVFSRIPEHEKLGCSNFEDLRKKKTTAIYTSKNIIEEKIIDLNIEIKKIEEMRNQDYKESLQNSYSLIKTEYDSHILGKPGEVIPPSELNTEEYQSWNDKIIELKDTIAIIESQYNQEYAIFDRLKALIEIIKIYSQEFDNFVSEQEKEFVDIDIRITDIIKLTVDFNSVTEKLNIYKQSLSNLYEKIANTSKSKGTMIIELELVEQTILNYNDANDGKLKVYQNFLLDMNEWNIKDTSLKNKLMNIKAEIEYIGDFTSSPIALEIQDKREQRLKLVSQLFSKIKEEVEIYDIYKKSISDFISNYKDQIEKYSIEINTGIFVKNNFANYFVEEYINNTFSSNFKGPDGKKILQEMLDICDFNSWDDLKDFLENLLTQIDTDSKTNPYKIFKNGKDLEFINYIFTLKFIIPEYSLQLYGKTLDKLSPGERGSLLLVFYLLLDARNIPLILDQPEDNLDNESVANILVPFIRDAKKRRQIIIVTHNANLAVVADAEQIIRVKIDKQNDNTFLFESGSLESKIVNDVVNVLEGTKISFDKRKIKYEI